MDCMIIGGGAAGLHAALTCRQCWPAKSVTLIEAEEEVGYYRPLLPLVMTGQTSEERLFFWRPEDDPRLEVRSGVKVAYVDRANQNVHLHNNQTLQYARLVLAPGGRPLMPESISDRACEGIFPVRDLTTARQIRQWLPDHRDIVVLGGGFVGVKTAVFLGLAGLHVSLIEMEDQLFPEVLTRDAARIVEEHLQRLGITVFLAANLGDVQVESRELKAVRVDQRWLPCDTLLVAIGSTSSVDFLEDTGLLEDGELVVSPTLQTRDDQIYAAGDAVKIVKSEAQQYIPWIWPQAISQGKLAGANLYRSVPHPLGAFTRPNAMNLHGLSMVVLGAQVPGAEVIRYTRPSEAIHRELFIQSGRIVGGVLVGDISGAGPLHAAMMTEKDMQEETYDLLQPHNGMPSRLQTSYMGQRRRAEILVQQECNA
jgi:NADPH-dependent 2,4-dienoyl-CoA reductase/sulfur reductase-like enzyme